MIFRYFIWDMAKLLLKYELLAGSAAYLLAASGKIDRIEVVMIMTAVAAICLVHSAHRDIGKNLNWMLTLPGSRMKLWLLNLRLNAVRLVLIVAVFGFSLLVKNTLPPPPSVTQAAPAKQESVSDPEKAAKKKAELTAIAVFGTDLTPYLLIVAMGIAIVFISSVPTTTAGRTDWTSGDPLSKAIGAYGPAMIALVLFFTPRSAPFLAFNFLLVAAFLVFIFPRGPAYQFKMPLNLRRRFSRFAHSLFAAIAAVGFFFITPA